MQLFALLYCHFIRKIRRLTDFNYFTCQRLANLTVVLSCFIGIFCFSVIFADVFSRFLAVLLSNRFSGLEI